MPKSSSVAFCCVAALSALTAVAQDQTPPASPDSVFVQGDVKKPGSYPLFDASGRRITVMAAIAQAGGVAHYFEDDIAVVHTHDLRGAKLRMSVELSKIREHKRPDFPLQAGDVVEVPDVKQIRDSFPKI